MGSVQIRNRAPDRQLCNASPAFDTATPLLVHDADIVLASGTGQRRVPLGDFLLGAPPDICGRERS